MRISQRLLRALAAAAALAVASSAGAQPERTPPAQPAEPAQPAQPAQPDEPPGAAQAPADEAPDGDERSELEQARERLEAAARDLARLSAEAAEPFVDNIVRRFDFRDRRATLGLVIQDADNGVRVTSVSPGGPAAQAGVRTGDVIVSIDGADVTGAAPSRRLLEEMSNVAPGDQVALEILRGDDAITLALEAGEFEPPRAAFARRGFEGFEPGDRVRILRDRGVLPFRTWQDMELVALTPELGEYFGTEEGMLVISAPEDDALGLRDGDVILEIGDRAPMSPEHAMRILASFAPGETLRLTILRRQERQTLEFEVPAAARRR